MYRENMEEDFPGGKMTKYLENLKVNEYKSCYSKILQD